MQIPMIFGRKKGSREERRETGRDGTGRGNATRYTHVRPYLHIPADLHAEICIGPKTITIGIREFFCLSIDVKGVRRGEGKGFEDAARTTDDLAVAREKDREHGARNNILRAQNAVNAFVPLGHE